MLMILTPILKVLRAVPWFVYAIVIALAWGGWQRHRAQATAAEYQQARDKAAAEREKDLAAVLAETNRRLVAQEEVTKHADTKTAQARIDAASAAGAAARLRQQLAALRSASPASGPAASSPGQTTDRLADVLNRCADRYIAVAGVADRAIIAGTACEASYEALRK